MTVDMKALGARTPNAAAADLETSARQQAALVCGCSWCRGIRTVVNLDDPDYDVVVGLHPCELAPRIADALLAFYRAGAEAARRADNGPWDSYGMRRNY